MMQKQRILVGVSGASGAPVAVDLLQALRDIPQIETHLIISRGGEATLEQETNLTSAQLAAMADVTYENSNIGAAVASGSYRTAGMVIVPCSMKTVAGIASGYSDNLLLRAADVILKERRRLVLVTRECPLSSIHLRNMLELSRMGAIILPPVLSYYNHPQTIADATHHIVGKILDCLGYEYRHFKRWEG